MKNPEKPVNAGGGPPANELHASPNKPHWHAYVGWVIVVALILVAIFH